MEPEQKHEETKKEGGVYARHRLKVQFTNEELQFYEAEASFTGFNNI
jgi:hypothetical protein